LIFLIHTKSYSPKFHPSLITPGCTAHQFLCKPPFIEPPSRLLEKWRQYIPPKLGKHLRYNMRSKTQQLTRNYTQNAMGNINLI